MRTNRFRGYVHWIGSGLSLLGIAFVILKLLECRDQLVFGGLNFWGWTFLCVLVMAYGISELMLALAWRHILVYLRVPVSARWAVVSYGISQLAKYIPGNIFHLAGRQVIGLNAGIAGWVLAKSSLLEQVIISITAVLFSILIVPLFIPSFGLTIAVVAFLVVLLCYIWISSYCFGVRIARAIFLYALFLSISGVIFAVLYFLIAIPEGHFVNAMVPLCGAYVIAWLAGLITPGAPAGVGVREATLYVLLHAITNQADLLAAILISRMLTIAGDVLFFLFSSVGNFTRKGLSSV